MKLTGKANNLYNLLFTKNFDAERLFAELASGVYDKDDVNLAAFQYVDDCLDDLADYEDENRKLGEIIPGFESSHMLEALRILLKYGLDPNRIIDVSEIENYKEESNIMSELRFVENGYIAADSLSLLLENGGNPSIIINNASLVRDINYDLIFDLYNMPNRYRYDALVHYWMVLVGYGAKLENGESTVDPCGDFDISKLRNHRQYYYGAIESDRSEDHMEICFFDKETNFEVARY